MVIAEHGDARRASRPRAGCGAARTARASYARASYDWLVRGNRICAAVALSLACALTSAADSPDATTSAAGDPVPEASSATTAFNGDVDFYSDYIGRGLTFSNGKPVLQARVEYDWAQGPYGGLAISNRADILDKESVEIDLYGGYRKKIGDWSIDVGAISWLYPHSRFDMSNNTYDILEAAVDITYKWCGVKFWYDVFDYLGLNDESAWANYHLSPNGASSGSSYIDSHLSLPVSPRFSFKLHAGHQFIRNYGELDYTDWLVGAEQTVGRSLTLGAAYTDTNANEVLYQNPNGLQIGRRKWLAYLRWSFP